MKKSVRVCALLLALFCVCSTSLSVLALEEPPITVTPLYTGLVNVQAYLSISGSGKASCTASARLRSGYTGTVTMELQRSTNKTSWSTIQPWTSSGSGTVELSKSYYVTPGYYYQVYVTVQVKTTSGSYVETAYKTSVSVTY